MGKGAIIILATLLIVSNFPGMNLYHPTVKTGVQGEQRHDRR